MISCMRYKYVHIYILLDKFEFKIYIFPNVKVYKDYYAIFTNEL